VSPRLARWRRPPVGDERERRLREREQLVEQRTKAVGERERAVARRVRELAAREEALIAREQARLDDPVVASAPERVEPVTRAHEAAPPSAPVAERLPLNVDELARLVDASSAPLELSEEWRTYLFFLRGYAALDGTLPESFESLVDEVFSDLRRRSR
jgi:hypothetical protein